MRICRWVVGWTLIPITPWFVTYRFNNTGTRMWRFGRLLVFRRGDISD